MSISKELYQVLNVFIIIHLTKFFKFFFCFVAEGYKCKKLGSTVWTRSAYHWNNQQYGPEVLTTETIRGIESKPTPE